MVGTAPSLEFEFLLMEGGGTRALPFPPSPFVIGSAEECQLRFPDSKVEPRHAEITVTGNTVRISDLTGRGQTWVNGLAVLATELSPGAMIRLGRLELMLRPPRPSSSSSSSVVPVVIAAEPVDQTTRRPTPFGEHALGFEASVPAITHQDAAQEPAPLPPPPQDRQLVPGTVVGGRYEITSRLAAGGMGEVYKARHVELNKAMAIKVMRHQLSSDPEFVARFKREAIATGSIGQMNIVDISDFGRTDDGRFYFVMEFLDGSTLSRVLRQEGALSTDRALHIAVQVARALTAAHSLGVVHRDLKPENIMLLQKPGQRDFVKVVDFGVAKLPNPDGTQPYTVMGMVVGTPQYMSPEQARAVTVDARSDIYSLGLILHEMLAGKPTFEAETAPSLMVKQVTETPAPLVIEANGSVELAELVMVMLAKSPDERPQTMEQVLLSLEDLISARRVTYPQTPVVQAPRTSTGARPSLATPAPGRTATGPAATLPPSLVNVPTEARPVTVKPGRPSTAEHPTLEQPAAERAPRTERAVAVVASDAELQEAAMPRSRGGLVAALVGALALAAAGAYFATRGSEPTPAPVTARPTPVDPAPAPTTVEPQPPVAEAMVSLRLQSTPPGAEIFEGETRLGTAPLTLERAARQTAELRFTLPGHTAAARTVTFTRDQTIDVPLTKVAEPHVAEPVKPHVTETVKPHVTETRPIEPVRPPHDTPALVDPYATEPAKDKDKDKDKPKQDLKEGVY